MDTATRVDPNLKIPAAVRAAGAKADAYYQQEAPAAQDTENGNTEAQPEEATAQATPEAPVEEPKAEAKEAPPTGASEQPKSEDDQSWEHRYKSMKGRYDRANDQLRGLSEQVASLQNVIATMQVSNSTPSDAKTEQAVERFITPEEENDYGQEFLKVVGKKAKEELLPVINKYEAKIAELEARLKGVDGYVTQDARTRMLSSLDEKVPNWREINKDDNFLNWLQLPDLYSGAIRHELLKEAFERNNTPRVQAFFTGFLAEEAALDPASGETGRTEAPANKVSLENLAAPGRAKSAAATNAPAEKPIFTRAQIAKFYADATAGKYKGREADRDRLERQIFEAERDGRIR